MKANQSSARFKLFVSALFLSILSSAATWAAPAQVILIRHAEKPEDEANNQLNARGFQRARALVGFFENNRAVTEFGTPVAIYAMAPKDEEGSVRAIQTVAPLAQDLGLPVRQNFTKKKVSKLVAEIMANPEYEGRMVLISWEHNMIAEIASALGIDNTPKWKDREFDRAWIISFKGDRAVSFRNLPQRLLPGDSAQ